MLKISIISDLKRPTTPPPKKSKKQKNKKELNAMMQDTTNEKVSTVCRICKRSDHGFLMYFLRDSFFPKQLQINCMRDRANVF